MSNQVQPPLPPNARTLAYAQSVVTDPVLFGDKPALRAWAWATLKAKRGQRVHQTQLDAMLRALRPVALTPPPLGGAA